MRSRENGEWRGTSGERKASSRLDSRKRIWSATSWRRALRLATANAAGEISVAQKFAAGNAFAKGKGVEPGPVPVWAVCRPSPGGVLGGAARGLRGAGGSRGTFVHGSGFWGGRGRWRLGEWGERGFQKRAEEIIKGNLDHQMSSSSCRQEV